MGLDMYAYKLKAEHAPADDSDMFDAVYKAMDFKLVDHKDFVKMSEKDQLAYLDAKKTAMNQAKTTGIFDGSFAYWRKFNALHGWMEDLWLSRGNDGDFNCTQLRLRPEDLDELQERVDDKSLEPRSGFFFGGTDPVTEDEYSELEDFITKARQAIADGYAVYYDSWW